MDDLTLGLDGTTLTFPDGVPRCLACGAAPAGVRRVYFEELEGPALTEAGKLAGHLSALAGRVVFDAPLCGPHLQRARRQVYKVAIHAAVALVWGVSALIVILEKHLDEQSPAWWLLAAPAAGFAVAAFLGWGVKDRGALTCSVTRFEDGRIRIQDPA